MASAHVEELEQTLPHMNEIMVREPGRVDAHVGDFITIEIEEFATAGYQSCVALSCPQLELVDYEYFAPTSGRMGPPGTRRIRLYATSTGQGELTVRERRLWENPPEANPPTFSVTVSVT